jgi:5-methylcytosine-specific restriction endonuclease McrA
MPRQPRKNQWKRAVSKCNGHCWYCGAKPEPGNLTVDHACPRSRGGKNNPENLLPACDYCNNIKGSRTVSGFRKLVKVMVIRRALELGYLAGDLSRIKIVFFGEGNLTPFKF